MALGGLDPNYPNSDVFGLNDNNIVAGDYVNMDAGLFYAMAWKWNGSTGGKMVDLGSISGGIGVDGSNRNGAAAINNNNQVAGYA